MAGTSDPYAAFRLNLEQQRKRAKDLLKARRAEGGRDVKLADAQFDLAHQLGFTSWRALRAHIASQTAERAAMQQPGPPLDADLRTLHLRCGSDIQHELVNAGFTGDFLSVWDPLPVGPVTRAADWISDRARFHAESWLANVGVADLLAELQEADRRLTASADEYERVVIWSEHDSHDQLSLVRYLARFATHRRPQVVELITVSHFPGSRRFIGLGQLPPEAMRLLWRRREQVSAAQLALAASTWRALTSEDPRELAAIMRSRTPSLPHLAPALHRHLQELPSSANGLGLTQTLILQLLAESASTLNELWQRYGAREPLPFLGDAMFLQTVDELGQTAIPLLERTMIVPGKPFRDQAAITEKGRDVLRGRLDWLTLQPPPRWVGGVRIDAGSPGWRWDDTRLDAIRT